MVSVSWYGFYGIGADFYIGLRKPSGGCGFNSSKS